MSYIQLFKTGHNEYQTKSTAEMKWKLKIKKQTNHFIVFDESEEYGLWCYATYGGTRDSEWVSHPSRKQRCKKYDYVIDCAIDYHSKNMCESLQLYIYEEELNEEEIVAGCN
tara:strand:+ start:339 stop:674 length:336 start_codon:yes stop_codon:yes gene_type:complete